MQNNSKAQKRWLPALMTFVAGMLAMGGVALAVKGTDQAAFCGSCHSMSEAVLSHKKSIHANFACNECHTPNNIVAKLPYKAAVGLHDIYATATNAVPDRIQTQGSMKDVIQANCRRCHVATTMTVDMAVKPYCTDCHRAVPHNNKLPIDRRKAADV